MKNLRDLSMRAKLAICIVPVMGAICTVLFLSFLSKIKTTESQAATERVRTISELTAREIGIALRTDDPKEVGRAVDSIGRQHNLTYLIVIADPATIQGEFKPDEARSSDFQNIGPQNELDVASYRISVPITRKRHPRSVCYAGIPLQDLHAASDGARSSLAVTALMLFFGGTLLAFGVILLVTRPLSRVLKMAEEAAKGNLQGRTPARCKDETGRLATAMNTLFLNMETTAKRIENLAVMLNHRDHELAQEVDRPPVHAHRTDRENKRQFPSALARAADLHGDLVSQHSVEIRHAGASHRPKIGMPPGLRVRDRLRRVAATRVHPGQVPTGWEEAERESRQGNPAAQPSGCTFSTRHGITGRSWT